MPGSSRRPAAALALALAACSGGEPPPPATVAEVPRYSVEEFLGVTTVFGASFSPDASKILVSSNESGIFNAYAVPVAGGDAVPLTESDADAVLVAGYFPDDERFLYLADQGGNELHHLYVREPDGRVVDLTPGDGLKASFAGWADDDRSFFVLTNERDRRYFDIYELAADGYQRTLLYRDEIGLLPTDVSRDKRYVAFAKVDTTYDSDVLVYDRERGEMRNLTAHQGEVANVPQAFTPDGSALLYTTDEGAEFSYLVRYDLGSGEVRTVERADWDVTNAGFSRDGRYLVVRVNNDGRTELRLYETEGHRRVALPDLGHLDITSVHFSADSRLLAFYASSSRWPQNLFVYDFSGAAPRQLTQTLNPAIDPDHLVDGEVVRFPSYDGIEVPGILYRPRGASPERPVPALVWVHGGPGGQSRLGYRDVVQFLVNHGYAVFAINNRGSSGYGKTFFRLDDRKHGDADLDDCVAGKRMLTETGWVDPEKIGIIGGSYGGYMVLAALAFRPQEFAVGVDLFGISNWPRTLESMPVWWESFREALYREMGHPQEDAEYLRSISPLFHAERIVRPLLVLQGANDPRVLKPESDDIVAAVRANGVPVEYVVFDDEGHGFDKKENEAEGFRAILEFLDTHLKGAPPAAVAAGGR